MAQTIAPWVALAVCCAGLAYKIATWFRGGVAPGAAGIGAAQRVRAAIAGILSAIFSSRIAVLAEAFVLDVLLQRKILKDGASRWVAHLCISAAFLMLLLGHALGQTVVARLFASYQPTLNPFLFVRDLSGALLLVGLAAAAYRRLRGDGPRRSTRPSDSYAIAILAVIAVSGVLLEATKIGSYSAYQDMARQYGGGDAADESALEAYWAARMGTASPAPPASAEVVARGSAIHEERCAGCHSRPQWAFLGYATASALEPAASWLDRADAAGLLWAVHFFACLVGLAYLPFSKMLHVVTVPLSLMVNAVVGRGKPSAASLATKQMLELDACTHCCTCSTRCSMAMAAEALSNDDVLPSEKIPALKALASGRELGARELRKIQEGVFLCTSCDRCTVACPSGIDLLGLWLGAKEALLARGEPEFSLLSPLALRRGLMKAETDPAAYRDAVDRPRDALAARFGAGAPVDGGVELTPGDGELWTALRRSLQASTFSSCFGCKTCSTACPVAREYPAPQQSLGLLPHQVMYSARLRLWDLVLGSNMLWDCLGCYQCQQSCPQGVGVADVIYELKNVAIAQAVARRALREGGRA